MDLAAAIDHARAHRNGVLTTDRKSTRLNSSNSSISYAVFCLKKKKKKKSTVLDLKKMYNQTSTKPTMHVQTVTRLVSRLGCAPLYHTVQQTSVTTTFPDYSVV